jgi:hypothetical protein
MHDHQPAELLSIANPNRARTNFLLSLNTLSHAESPVKSRNCFQNSSKLSNTQLHIAVTAQPAQLAGSSAAAQQLEQQLHQCTQEQERVSQAKLFDSCPSTKIH